MSVLSKNDVNYKSLSEMSEEKLEQMENEMVFRSAKHKGIYMLHKAGADNVMNLTKEQRGQMEVEAMKLLELDNFTLLKHYEFFAHILARTIRKIDYGIPIAAVSLRNADIIFHLNPISYGAYTKPNRLFILVHEIKHILQLHHARGKDKDRGLYNIATDVSINQDIENDICKLPKDILRPDMFKLPLNLNADQYYDILLERNEKIEIPDELKGTIMGNALSNQNCPKCGGSGQQPQNGQGQGQQSQGQGQGQQPGDGQGQGQGQQPGNGQGGGQGDGQGQQGHGQGNGHSHGQGGQPCDCCGGSGKKKPGKGLAPDFENMHPTWDENTHSEEITRQIVRGIVQDAISKSRGNIPGFIAQEVNEIMKSKVNWKQVLRNFVARQVITKKNPTWAREKRNGIPDVMGYKKERQLNLVVGVDTSGSVRSDQLAQFKAEIHKMHQAGAKITIIECDMIIHRVYEYKRNMEPTFAGRGGTHFTPVFDYISSKGDDKFGKLKDTPDAVIFLTDGYGSAPDKFKIPTLWVLTNDGVRPSAESGGDVSWGRRKSE